MVNAREGARWMIGVDVGGTKVAAGFVNGRGELGEHLRAAMNPCVVSTPVTRPPSRRMPVTSHC